MSVILDALAKARGDKRNQQAEPQPNSVARVLDSGTAPSDFPAGAVAPRRRNWLAGIAVVFGLLCLLALIGGGFFLLYDQVRRLEAKSVMQETALVEPPAKTQNLLDTTPVDINMPETLPPPVPEAELPVQVPTTSRLSGTNGTAAGSTVYAAPGADQAGAAALPIDPPSAAAGAQQAGLSANAPVAADTTAAAPQTIATPEFKLGSIVCEDNICVASLNGRSVRVGDEIRGYEVIAISETSISLQGLNGQDTLTLSLFD